MPLTIGDGINEEQSKRTEGLQVGAPAWLHHLLLGFVGLASMATLFLLLKYSHYGIDFTDESFYLIWIANPYLYDVSVSQFGFIYHPLYRLLDGDVAALRQANFLITYGLAALAAGAVLGSVTPSSRLGLLPRTVIALGLACVSLVLFAAWRTSPSYNSLNLQSLLLAATGLAWSCSVHASTRLRGHLMIGLGGWMSFMAKPSTALVLAVVVMLFWLLTRRLTLRGVLVSALTATLLLLASALWIDGSVGSFIDRLTSGLEMASTMGGGHTISNLFRLDPFKPTNRDLIHFFAFTALLFACAQLLSSQRPLLRTLGALLASTVFLCVILWTSGLVKADLRLGKFQVFLYAAIPLAAMLILLTRWLKKPRDVAPFSSKTLLPLLAMPFLAYAFAFGTNTNYWATSTFAAFFWLMPTLVLAMATEERHHPVFSLVPMVLAAQAITVLVLQYGMERPYRQVQPLRLNDQMVDFGKPGSTLKLSTTYADYLNAATGSARAAGLVPGTPMIDLSGQSPGILYALQAESLGSAWMIGGYKGSVPLAAVALASVPCEKLARAWVLAEPDGPRSLPAELLNAHGIDLTAHHQHVATWTTAAGAGGFRHSRRQILWKPARDPLTAQQACQLARNEGAR